MFWSCMVPQSMPRPECLLTTVAWERNTFQMVSFNVIPDSTWISFFSTHFANFSLSLLFAIWNHRLTLAHHWFYLCIEFLQVGWDLLWNCSALLIKSCLFVLKVLKSFRGSGPGLDPLTLLCSNWEWELAEGSCNLSSCPINPLSLSSSARARNESRFSWKIFASPQYRKSKIALMSSDLIPLI